VHGELYIFLIVDIIECPLSIASEITQVHSHTINYHCIALIELLNIARFPTKNH